MNLDIEGLQEAKYLEGDFYIFKITFVADIQDAAGTQCYFIILGL